MTPGDGGILIFNSLTQQVTQAGDGLAGAWPILRAAGSWDDMTDAARQAGIATDDLRDLVDMGILQPVRHHRRPARIACADRIRIGRTVILIGFDDAGLRAAARPVIGHLQVSDATPIETYVTVARTGRGIQIAPEGDRAVRFADDGFAPGLKIALTEIAFRHVEEIVLHAASVSHGDRAILLFGDPGAGKSTLSYASSRLADLVCEGDDLAELLPDGHVMPMAFAAAIKTGACRLRAPLAPELETAPEHVRPDGKIVRYLPLPRNRETPLTVAAAVSLDRRSDGPAGLTAIGKAEMMRIALNGAWTESRTVSPSGFDALAACVAGAGCYRLTYSDLRGASDLLHGLLHDSDPLIIA